MNFKTLDWFLICFRIGWYGAAVALVPKLTSAVSSTVLAFVLGVAVAVITVLLETGLTAVLRRRTFSQVLVARFLIVDHMVAGSDQSVLTQQRKMLGQAEEKRPAGQLEEKTDQKG